MATAKYSRVDNNSNNRRAASGSYCSKLTIVVFVALCLVGIWMITSSSVQQNVDVSQENESKSEVGVSETEEGSGGKQTEDNLGDLPEDEKKGDSNEGVNQVEEKQVEDQIEEKQVEDQIEEKNEDKTEEGLKIENVDGGSKVEGGKSKGEIDESNVEYGGKKGGGDNEKKDDSSEDGNEKKSDDDKEKKTEKAEGTNENPQIDEKVEETNKEKVDEKSENVQVVNQSSTEVFPSVAQSELLKETTTQNGPWSTQSAESNNEKEAQRSSDQQTGYAWKLCNSTAGPDFIPCLDNLQAIRSLRSTKHYEHRERHCPEEPPTCLLPLPAGYKRPIEWPMSREKIWYYNVPHTKLAQYKGRQNWVKVSGEFLTFPGGGTQFKHGALHYIDWIQESVSDIAWGKRTRVILDVGCGVASFGGFLFDREVVAMSFAPKDEHEAQVQFALERGIPAISAVMGTQRLPYPSGVCDVVHCARCRVPWHIEGGKLLLELNRVLRPGGFFVWSATPVYQRKHDDAQIWQAMKVLTEKICWKLVRINKDKVNGIGAAIYRKPTTNECYERRSQNDPPICDKSDDPNAAWKVPLQACLHKVPVEASERGSQWPEQWPARLDKAPYWLLSSQTGVYGKPAPEDFNADYEHWKRVVDKSYLNGMGINWSSVRNVMDMRSVYGGFAAALKDLKLWVMNIVTIDSPDTLPIIYERGLLGMYHDWCESFSTYPRSYDLLHADHLFSLLKKRCKLITVVAEVDRILRPEGKLIVRDTVETINELDSMLKSMQWEVRMTYSKDKEGLLCVQKSMWRPKEIETIKYAIA